PATFIPYRFILSGVPLPTAVQLDVSLTADPPLPDGHGVRPPNYVIVYIPPNTPPQTYRLSLATQDGDRLTATLVHTPWVDVVGLRARPLLAEAPFVFNRRLVL